MESSSKDIPAPVKTYRCPECEYRNKALDEVEYHFMSEHGFSKLEEYYNMESADYLNVIDGVPEYTCSVSEFEKLRMAGGIKGMEPWSKAMLPMDPATLAESNKKELENQEKEKLKEERSKLEPIRFLGPSSKVFICSFCQSGNDENSQSKDFQTPEIAKMSKHLEEVHGVEYPHKCQFCGLGTFSRQTMTNHRGLCLERWPDAEKENVGKKRKYSGSGSEEEDDSSDDNEEEDGSSEDKEESEDEYDNVVVRERADWAVEERGPNYLEVVGHGSDGEDETAQKETEEALPDQDVSLESPIEENLNIPPEEIDLATEETGNGLKESKEMKESQASSEGHSRGERVENKMQAESVTSRKSRMQSGSEIRGKSGASKKTEVDSHVHQEKKKAESCAEDSPLEIRKRPYKKSRRISDDSESEDVSEGQKQNAREGNLKNAKKGESNSGKNNRSNAKSRRVFQDSDSDDMLDARKRSSSRFSLKSAKKTESRPENMRSSKKYKRISDDSESDDSIEGKNRKSGEVTSKRGPASKKSKSPAENRNRSHKKSRKISEDSDSESDDSNERKRQKPSEDPRKKPHRSSTLQNLKRSGKDTPRKEAEKTRTERDLRSQKPQSSSSGKNKVTDCDTSVRRGSRGSTGKMSSEKSKVKVVKRSPERRSDAGQKRRKKEHVAKSHGEEGSVEQEPPMCFEPMTFYDAAKGVYRCKLCSSPTFPDDVAMSIHLVKHHHIEYPFKCQFCSMGSNNKETIILHQELCVGDKTKPFLRKEKSKEQTPGKLRARVSDQPKKVEKKIVEKPKMEKKASKSKKSLDEPVSCYNQLTDTYQCSQCPESFNKLYKFSLHLELVHKMLYEYKCKHDCGFATTSSKVKRVHEQLCPVGDNRKDADSDESEEDEEEEEVEDDDENDSDYEGEDSDSSEEDAVSSSDENEFVNPVTEKVKSAVVLVERLADSTIKKFCKKLRG